MKPCTCDLFDGDGHYIMPAVVFDQECWDHGYDSARGEGVKHRARESIIEIIGGAFEEEFEESFESAGHRIWRAPWVPMHALGIMGQQSLVVCVLDGTRDWTTLEIQERMLMRYFPVGDMPCVEALAQQLRSQAEQAREAEAGAA